MTVICANCRTENHGVITNCHSCGMSLCQREPAPGFNKSGSKYLRHIITTPDGLADVYAVLDAFDVRCPARQHAIKKLLCSGLRGKGSALQDLTEAGDAITRAIDLQTVRENPTRE